MTNRTGDYICSPDHAHGETAVCYNHHKCRCGDCREYMAMLQYRREHMKKAGRYDRFVPVGPVREHLTMLAEHGIGYKHVAALAGVSVTTVGNALYGKVGSKYPRVRNRISRETAEKILSVKPVRGNLPPTAKIPARGSVRRVQALVALGWGLGHLADQLRISRGDMHKFMKSDLVTVRRADLVDRVYSEMCMKTPPASTTAERYARSRALMTARKHGWVPPLAWDDIDSDSSPQADPVRSLADEWHARSGESRLARFDVLDRVRALGLSWQEIGDAFGETKQAVQGAYRDATRQLGRAS